MHPDLAECVPLLSVAFREMLRDILFFHKQTKVGLLPSQKKTLKIAKNQTNRPHSKTNVLKFEFPIKHGRPN